MRSCRRCLVLELKLPRDDSALIAHLVERAGVHFPKRAKAIETYSARRPSYCSPIVEPPGKGT